MAIKFFADIDTTGEVEGDIIDGVNYKINGSQGNNGQVLTSTGSGVAWESVASGSVSGNTFAADLKIGRDADNHLDFATADDTIDVYINGQKDFTFTANTFTAQSGSTIAAQAITATTVDATTDFTIGTTVITDDSIVMTPSSSDTVSITAATHGVLNIATFDNAGTDGDINIVCDGRIEYRANDADGHIFDINGTNQVTIIDGSISPVTSNDIDLGSASKQFKNAWFDGNVETDALTIAGSNIVTGGVITTIGVIEQTNVQFTCDNFTVVSSSSEAPNILIKSTSNDEGAGTLLFDKRRGSTNDAQDEDVVGNIVFRGLDDGTPSVQEYAKIIGSVQDASSGAEEGQLDLQVASHDGELATGLSLFSGDQEDEVDVRLGNGANCRVTIPGNLVIGSTTLPSTALAGTADTITSARTFRTDLASTSTASFDGSADVTPGVTGTLAVGNGGTGVTTMSALKNALDDETWTFANAATFTGNINANGNIVGDDSTSITNIESIGADAYTADAESTTKMQMGASSIEFLVGDTDVFDISDTQFNISASVKATIPRRSFAKTGNTDGTANGDVVYFGGTTSMTTGAIYHYKSDGTWELADADAAANCDGLLGVALGAASDTNGVLLRGMVTLDHDPGAVGDVLFLSTTAGDCSATAPSGNGDIIRVVGYCLDASNGQIYFNPDGTYVEVSA